MSLPLVGVGKSNFSIASASVWYKANAESYNDLDLVDTLNDQSGNGNNATAAGSARPVFRTGIINGLPVIRFDAVDDILQKSNVVGLSANAFTFYIVCAPNSAASISFGQFLSISNTNPSYFAEIRRNSAGTSYQAIAALGGTPATDGAIGASGTFKIVGSRWNGGPNCEIYLKDVIQDSQSDGGGTFVAQHLCLGARVNLTLFNNCDIAELLCYNSALGPAGLSTVSNYLATKYAL